MQEPSNLLASLKSLPRWRIGAAALLAVALGLIWLRSGGGPTAKGATFAARRGPLDITVLEGGSIQALQSQELKCEVRVGYQGTKILKIIDEGYSLMKATRSPNRTCGPTRCWWSWTHQTWRSKSSSRRFSSRLRPPP